MYVIVRNKLKLLYIKNACTVTTQVHFLLLEIGKTIFNHQFL